ncbi:hypothetical protein AB5J49_00980 [Streptomyces sp. R28]|uniref:Uncharacterized protein n=1 Tax=Streptomyces sp. R28 TaxID=3238628 RepID=A0AB39QE60_9ACTN
MAEEGVRGGADQPLGQAGRLRHQVEVASHGGGDAVHHLPHAALTLGNRPTMARAHTALTPAAHELVGVGSGMLTLGPGSAHVADLADTLGRTRGRFDESRRRTGE